MSSSLSLLLSQSVSALIQELDQLSCIFSEYLNQPSNMLSFQTKEAKRYASEYYFITSRLSATLENSDQAGLRISRIIVRADEEILPHLVQTGDTVLCAYQDLRVHINELLQQGDHYIKTESEAFSPTTLYSIIRSMNQQVCATKAILQAILSEL